MSSLAASDERTVATPAKVIQPAWVRAMHWTNAVAMILMIMSGWQIYNASPLFAFKFAKSITLGDNEIGIDNFQFTPAVLTVKPGTKVTWINNDDVPHLIVDKRGKFTSPVLDSDQRFSTTLKQSGTYNYYCSLHPMMQGSIIVK